MKKLYIIFLLLLTSSAFADVVQLDDHFFIKADQIEDSEYYTVVKGAVEVWWQDLELETTEFYFDKISRQVFLEAPSVIEGQGAFLFIEEGVIDLDRAHASFKGISGTIEKKVLKKDVKGSFKAFLWAEEMVVTEEDMIAHKVTFTSCDKPQEELDFSLLADKLIWSQGKDQLIFKGVRAQIGSLRTFKWPSYTMRLTQTRGENGFEWGLGFPQIGSTELLGTYIKNQILYSFSPKNFGFLQVDYHSIAGWGLGFNHFLSWGKNRFLRLNAYRLLDSETVKSYRIAGMFRYDFDDENHFRARYRSFQDETLEGLNPRVIQSENVFEHESEERLFAVGAYFSREGSTENDSFFLRWRERLSQRWDLFAEFDYTRSEVITSQNQAFHYLVGTDYYGSSFDAQLAIEGLSNDNLFFLHRLPEARVRTELFEVLGLPIQASLQAGYLRETPSGVATERMRAGLELPEVSFSLLGGELTSRASFRQDLYGNTQSQFQVATRNEFDWFIGENLYLEANHYWQYRDGYTPFASDLTIPHNLLVGGAGWRDRYWHFGVSTGYDFKYRRELPLVATVGFETRNKGFGLTSHVRYDRSSSRLGGVDTSVRLKVTPEIGVEYWNYYDAINDRLTYQDLALSWEHHDFLTRVVYRSTFREVYFQFNLKSLGLPYNDIGPSQKFPTINRNGLPYAAANRY